MIKRNIQLSEEMFRFDSEENWIASAQRKFQDCHVHSSDYICLDSKGVVCRIGKHFREARENDSYPIIVYKLA